MSSCKAPKNGTPQFQSLTPSQVKQFIRNVRASKTIADERAVVQKESAAIRASFREESGDSNVRRNNVAKLLYLFTLGERTHFGQIECLKLLASPRFADKRLGYLGTMLLLDENQEVLTLVTNSLKNDLNHSNQYIVGLALCTLGNIASVEMSRDLFPEIETLLSTANPYIRRKAALCAMRICRKVPDLQEHFFEKASSLLSDRNHGVLLCGLTLVTSLCEADEVEGGEEGVVEKFRPFVGGLVRTLKGLASSGYAPEHDVTGITDPFLQVKILQLLRVLGRGDPQTSEQINDILAQVATNTDSSKNVGNSILYEAVLTILDIDADSGLRVLGVNILGKFLTNRDNNIRYVALNTLIKVVVVEPNAVQRHRNTILECLRDPDISIRRRALDLSFTLINESNVRLLIRELLAFLEVADNEFKPIMTSQIGIAADRFSPNKRWHIDTMLRVLSLAGNYVKEQILSSFIRLIATTPELQTYAVQKLYISLKKDITQESLTLAGAWCIGEFGEALLRGGQYEEEELVKEVKEHEIVNLFSTILNSSYATQIATEYIITSMMKLTTRLSDPAQIDRVRRILQSNSNSLDIEIQQRAVEYGNLFGYDAIRRGVLEKMPPPQIKEESRVFGEAAKKPNKAANRKSKSVKPAEQDLLFDLMGDGDMPAGDLTSSNGSQNNTDLLADILGGTSSPPTVSPGAQQSNMSSIMDLFGTPGQSQPVQSTPAITPFDGMSSPAPQPAAPSIPTHLCYDKHDLNISLQLQRNAEGTIQVMARFRNTSMHHSLSAVALQAAVPKTQKLQLNAMSNPELGAGAEATQSMRITGSKGPPLRLRLKISYGHPSAGAVTDQVDWSEPR
ncbi:Gamma-adaptin [Hyphodiscus hymeniophilus]|uniref:AP-1 complex subunit gamma n=1 Tax=Hyphodiscus hymeniophilus TaxID=353542 RepID=A0A9P7AV41_9HELO|nr:Gamma-adaptin [Hyphodiscus hymeniophilus]